MDIMDAMDAICGVLGRLLMREALGDDVQIFSDTSDSGYVCQVVLPPLGNLVFEGQECSTEEAAQASALQVCLEAFAGACDLARKGLVIASKKAPQPSGPNGRSGEADWVEVIEEEVQEPSAKRAKTDAPQILPIGRLSVPRPKVKVKAMPKPPSTVPDVCKKAQLHTLISRLIGRSATKADVIYEEEQVQEGWQASVTLPPLGGQVVIGFPALHKKEADISAADLTIQWLQESFPMPNAPVTVPPPSRKRPRSEEIPSVQVMPPVAKVNKKVVRSMSSTSIQVQEGLEFCLQWRDTRLEACTEADIQDPSSIDYYFGQVCLVCQAVVSVKGWDAHAKGKKHLQKLLLQPMRLRPEVERPLPAPPCELLGIENFLAHGSWGSQDSEGEFPAVLTLGEMDFSFSLAVAQLRPAGTPLVATSFLGEHDPNEPEVHPADDGERAAYRRVSLPGMKGALQKNIDGLNFLGAQVLHSVDATDLEGTLRTQGIDGGFHIVVFPFPRFSLSRAPNPNNSRLLRDFFTSAMNGVVLPGGLIQLVMLSSQYEDWDVNGMANDVGLKLSSRVQLPPTFYQPREMSGKPWTPPGAELLTFEVGDLDPQ